MGIVRRRKFQRVLAAARMRPADAFDADCSGAGIRDFSVCDEEAGLVFFKDQLGGEGAGIQSGGQRSESAPAAGFVGVEDFDGCRFVGGCHWD